MHLLLTTISVLVAGVSFFGWGVVTRWAVRRSSGPWPTTIGLGMASVIILGGVVNLCRIAYAPVLFAIIAAGLVMVAVRAKNLRPVNLVFWKGHWALLELGLTVGVIATITLLTIVATVPPSAFNFHDDLEKYFAHPMRMLATGTLFGSSLSSLGSETLGGQAFLHGFVLAAFPIQYVSAVDEVFGFVLLMALAAAAGWRRMRRFPVSTVCVMSVVLVAPQCVNISAVYTGAALVATAVLLIADNREQSTPPIGLAIVYAALIALKPTFGLFVIIHVILSLPAMWARLGSWRSTIVWAGLVALGGTLAVAPWLLLYLPNYLQSGEIEPAISVDNSSSVQGSILSTQRLPYGSGATFAHYTGYMSVAVLTVMFAATVPGVCKSAGRRAGACGIVAGAASGAATYLILILALARVLSGYESNLRYTIPILLGSIVITAGLALELSSTGWRRTGSAILLLAVSGASAAFIPSALQRMHQAASEGNLLAFWTDEKGPAIIAYTDWAMSDKVHQFIRELQAKVPRGEPIVVWIAVPFHLDYRRNPIIDAEPAGLATPWAKTPADVRYYLWQYSGTVVRSPDQYAVEEKLPGRQAPTNALRASLFASELNNMANNSTVLYLDQQIILFKKK